MKEDVSSWLQPLGLFQQVVLRSLFLPPPSLRLKTKEGVKGARINFLHEVATAQATRKVLIEMVEQTPAID
jgi:hypothetical protein